MKKFAICYLLFAICASAHAAAPLSGTAGSNLTAYNGGAGAMNNNMWAAAQSERAAAVTAAANFGNCDALIQRCATPKCATGGCATMEIAYPIVQGCVMANDDCKGHGEALIQSIAGQIVANTVARQNAEAAAAAASANAQATADANATAQQMQAQLQQIQQQQAQVAAAQTAAMEAALAEQRALIEQQAAAAAATPPVATQTAPETAPADDAVALGVSADILAREQASGQIMTQLENADVALASLRATMQNAFDYAGCDASGNNCTGPKRARAFKQKAGEFFDPYETVLDEVYDALIMAQSLGVDITDIYMMLNGTCNVWGKYLCQPLYNNPDQSADMHYTSGNCIGGMSQSLRNVIGGRKCTVGQVIPMNDGGCQLIQMLNNQEEVQQNWLYPDQGDGGMVRVGCASEALDNSLLFRGRKKQATIDIETLRRIIEQDAPNAIGSATPDAADMTKYCAVANMDALQRAAGLRQLPTNVCVSKSTVDQNANVALLRALNEDISRQSQEYFENINQAARAARAAAQDARKIDVTEWDFSDFQ